MNFKRQLRINGNGENGFPSLPKAEAERALRHSAMAFSRFFVCHSREGVNLFLLKNCF
jgi:hypothetical protein